MKITSHEKSAAKAKRTNTVLFCILALFIAALLLLLLIYKFRHTFTAKKWAAYPENRTLIVSDLLEKHSLTGMTESEILALLGEHNNDRGYFSAENRFVYYMGPERGFISIDSEWLIIDFENGAVSEVTITTD